MGGICKLLSQQFTSVFYPVYLYDTSISLILEKQL